MKIRDRLSLQFSLTFAILLLLVLTSIYLLVEKNRKAEFFNRLNERAYTIAELFLAEDNMSKEKFEEVQKRYPLFLPDEIVNIYNSKFEPVFINQKSSQWPSGIIQKVMVERKISYVQGARQCAGIYYSDNSGDFVVLISALDRYGYDRKRQLLYSMIFTFLASVVVMFFLGRWFAWTALAPISKAVKEVKIIRASNLDSRLQAKDNKDEITELVMTFNNLLEHLEQSFNAQRSFVTHASHELRTPLTSIMGNIEVTLTFERTKEEYKAVLQQVLNTTEKLNQLTNNLFELAQTAIDVNDFEDVRLDELIWQVKDEWANKVPGAEIELVYNLSPDERRFTIKGKPYLLYTAFGNLLDNALKFSKNKPVSIFIDSTPDATLIRVRDKGIGIEPADKQQIFKPLQRGANAREYAGFGIGLSLTEKILLLHSASITVNNEYLGGTEFVVTFPNLR